MKTNKAIGIFACGLIVAAASCVYGENTERLTEELVKQFIVHMDELVVQEKYDDLKNLYAEDTDIICYATPAKKHPARTTRESIVEAGKYISFISQESIPGGIMISDDGTQATVTTWQTTRVQGVGIQRIVRMEFDVTLTLGVRGEHTLITSAERTLTGRVLEPDELTTKILVAYAEHGKIDPAQAVAWIEEIGGRYFENGKKIDMSYANAPVGNEVLLLASQIPGVRMVGSAHRLCATDEGLGYLKKLDSLMILDLSHSAITDNGLQALSNLDRLISLNLRGTPVTDAGLKHLEKLEDLAMLDILETGVTEEGVKRLQGKLPQLKISHESTFDSSKGIRPPDR